MFSHWISSFVCCSIKAVSAASFRLLFLSLIKTRCLHTSVISFVRSLHNFETDAAWPWVTQDCAMPFQPNNRSILTVNLYNFHSYSWIGLSISNHLNRPTQLKQQHAIWGNCHNLCLNINKNIDNESQSCLTIKPATIWTESSHLVNNVSNVLFNWFVYFGFRGFCWPFSIDSRVYLCSIYLFSRI